MPQKPQFEFGGPDEESAFTVVRLPHSEASDLLLESSGFDFRTLEVVPIDSL